MVSSSFISAAALLAAAATTASAAAIPEASTSGKTYYKIATLAKEPTFNELWLQAFHTGAGENAIVAQKSSVAGTNFYFENTNLIANLSAVVGAPQEKYGVYLGQGLYNDDSAPGGYNAVEANIDQATKGFYRAKNGTLGLGSTFAKGFNHWELCYVKEVSSNDEFGPDYQLLWKKTGEPVAEGGECVPVQLVLYTLYQ